MPAQRVLGTLAEKQRTVPDTYPLSLNALLAGCNQKTSRNPVLDLDYDEDSAADADANFVLLSDGKIAEAQATAEGACYDEEGLLRLLRLARITASRNPPWPYPMQ
jgi:ribonuclease PH